MDKEGVHKAVAARQALLAAIQYLRHSMKQATAEAKGGKVLIGILYEEPPPGTGGRIVARFEAKDFVEDVAAVIDAPPYTEEDELSAKAEELLQKHGLK